MLIVDEINRCIHLFERSETLMKYKIIPRHNAVSNQMVHIEYILRWARKEDKNIVDQCEAEIKAYQKVTHDIRSLSDLSAIGYNFYMTLKDTRYETLITESESFMMFIKDHFEASSMDQECSMCACS